MEAPVTPASVTPVSTPVATAVTPVGTSPTSDWTTGFDDSMKGWIQNKGFKNPSDLANSYLNLEKLHGVPQDRLLKLPENMDTPEGRAIWDKLGASSDPKEYKLDIPKEIGDSKMAEVFAQKFSELGVPKGMAEKITKTWNEYVGGQMKAQTESLTAQLAQEQAALKKEWGAAHDQNVQIGKEAAKKFGFDAGTIDKLESAMGYQGVMKLMNKLGSAIGEHSYVGGQSPGFGDAMAPAQAKMKMDAMMGDPGFKSRYLTGDPSAKAEYTKLAAMAYPGDMTV